jgi:predicted O-methyltransferase YrrM
MDKSHPRFIEKLEEVGELELSYKKTGIPTPEGEFLHSQIREHEYTHTIEIGCALGLASLYMCDALSACEDKAHTIIDPYQTTQWHSIGIKNLRKFGFEFFTLIEKPSEIALPQLLEQNASFDFAFIDGWHTFDHTLLDFFYLNRLIRVGGMIVFDDVRYPSVAQVLRYVAKYPNYVLVTDEACLVKEGKRLRALKMAMRTGQQLCKVFPAGLRQFFFSNPLLSPHPIHYVLLRRPRWLALRKTAEDQRDFDWYEDF